MGRGFNLVNARVFNVVAATGQEHSRPCPDTDFPFLTQEPFIGSDLAFCKLVEGVTAGRVSNTLPAFFSQQHLGEVPKQIRGSSDLYLKFVKAGVFSYFRFPMTSEPFCRMLLLSMSTTTPVVRSSQIAGYASDSYQAGYWKLRRESGTRQVPPNMRIGVSWCRTFCLTFLVLCP